MWSPGSAEELKVEKEKVRRLTNGTCSSRKGLSLTEKGPSSGKSVLSPGDHNGPSRKALNGETASRVATSGAGDL